MTGADFVAILPLVVMAATSIAVIAAIAIHRSHIAAAVLTFIGLAASFGALWIAAGVIPRQVTPLVIVDRYALFYTGLIVAATLAVVVLSYGYFEKQRGHREELYVLLTVAVLGAAVLVSSNHFVSFFLGLEVLSVPLYGLASYLHSRKLPVEAGLKYLVLAAASAAFLLFGMALVYAGLGTMSFLEMARLLNLPGQNNALVVPGLALIVTGIGFKLAVVPFHLWTPDVYEGAPAPVTAFIATVSKGAMFGLLLRFFYESGGRNYHPLFLVFSIIAIASMIAGNLLALLQSNVKRILAYSSIAHLGYMLVAFQAGGAAGAEAVTYYLVAYFVTMLGSFGVVTVLSGPGRDADSLEDYRGLFWRRPLLGGVFTAMLLSLAGIPITAGFLGKFYVIAAGAASAIWGLIVILVVTSAIGLFYYLRIVVVLYERAPEAAGAPRSIAHGGVWVLGILTVLLVWFGVSPSPLLDAIRTVVASLVTHIRI